MQDAFCRPLEVWRLHGIPENPSAWLMATAKNRALDALRRERTARALRRNLDGFSTANGHSPPLLKNSLPPARSKMTCFA